MADFVYKHKDKDGENHENLTKMDNFENLDWLERPPMVEEIETKQEEESQEVQVRIKKAGNK